MIGGGPIPSILLTPENTRLRVANGPGTGRVFTVEKMKMLVGRSDPPFITVDIDLKECELGAQPMVSRRHAEILWVNGELQVVDLGSANGTFVNGSRLMGAGTRGPSNPVPLTLGALVKFGDVELEVGRDER